MLREIRAVFGLLLAMTVLTGIVYPLAVTGIAAALFPREAEGSLIRRDGKVIGSALIGQSFSAVRYFHGRPSAAGTGYDAANSGGSNLAPSSRKLVEDVAARVQALRAENPDETAAVPVDLVTASASGLDPHISPAGAFYQVRRVAAARAVPAEEVRRLVAEHIEPRVAGLLGEPVVNVLAVNLALDRRWPKE